MSDTWMLMSYEAQDWIGEQPITSCHHVGESGVRLMLMWYARHADDDWVAAVGSKRIARVTGIDRRDLHEALKHVEANGWLTRAGKGKRGVTKYRIGPGPTCRDIPAPVSDSRRAGERAGERAVISRHEARSRKQALTRAEKGIILMTEVTRVLSEEGFSIAEPGLDSDLATAAINALAYYVRCDADAEMIAEIHSDPLLREAFQSGGIHEGVRTFVAQEHWCDAMFNALLHNVIGDKNCEREDYDDDPPSAPISERSAPEHREPSFDTGGDEPGPKPVDRFAEFWALWPKKEDKGHAKKAYEKHEKHHDAIMAGLAAQLPKMRRMIDNGERRYIPMASTWLNGERWDDEVEPERVSASADYGSDDFDASTWFD